MQQGQDSNLRNTRLIPYTPHTFVWNGLEPLSPAAFTNQATLLIACLFQAANSSSDAIRWKEMFN